MARKLKSAVCALVAGTCLGALTLPSDTQIKGIDLGRACRSAQVEDQALCRGFIEGFNYGTQMSVDGRFFSQWRYGADNWCFTDLVKTDDLRDEFLRFAQANTQTLHFPAAVVLATAFAAKYPCR